jgi:hypothetical protein
MNKVILRKIYGALIRFSLRLFPFWTKSKFLQKCFFYSIEMYFPNIKNPSRIREVIFRNKIKMRPLLSKYIDKHKVKSVIDEINDKSSLSIKYAETIAIYSDPKDIDFNLIKESCYIKATHGSHMQIFFEPNITNKNFVISEAGKWLNIDYSKISGEMNYTGVEKNILLERPVCEVKDRLDFYDIKIHCTNGTPIMIQILQENKGILNRVTYDSKWRKREWFKNECLFIDLSEILKHKIIEYAKYLSTDFDYVRIDFFLCGSELYFAEFTFSPAAAHIPLINGAVDRELYKIYLTAKGENL